MNCKWIILAALAALLSGCNAINALNVINDAKCVTEIAEKDSKFSCEFEGKKLIGKK